MKRLIIFILIFAIFLGFIVLNLHNSCDISFGFATFSDVPIFLSALFSFALGMMFTLPLVLLGKKKKPALPRPLKPSKKTRKSGGLQPLEDDRLAQGTDEIKKENSPYGID